MKTNLGEYAPAVNYGAIVSAGATELQKQAPAELYQAVLFAYNRALDQTFYIAVALPCLGLVGVLGLELTFVKEKKATDSGNAGVEQCQHAGGDSIYLIIIFLSPFSI